MTSKNQNGIKTKQGLLFAEASRVNHLAEQEKGGQKVMNATCGPKCLDLLRKLNQPMLFAKTLLVCSKLTVARFLKTSSLTCKVKGTKSKLLYCQLHHSVQSTKGTEFGLLPTPAASNAKGAVRSRFLGSKLSRSNLDENLRLSLDAPTTPNPEFLEIMMGFPVGWTSLQEEE